jgi:nucleoside-diphosphate-sugar epimerase
MPLKLLITGASGFIGKHLLADLLKQKLNICAAARSHSDLPFPTFVVGKIDGATNWSAAISGCDAVIHLAACAHVTNQAKIDKSLLHETNVEGTARLAQEAAKAGVKHFIFISSIGAMADTSNKVLCADAPCSPTTLYGQSKLMAEKELKFIAGKYGMEWTIIRPPLVYGPGNPGNMQRLLKLIRSGIPLPLASVRNRRSFVYVENLVDVIVACLGNPKAFGKTYLPSDGEDVSTPELIRKIAKANQSFQFLAPRRLGVVGGELTTTERRGRREVEQPKVDLAGARLAGASESKETENTEVLDDVYKNHETFCSGATNRESSHTSPATRNSLLATSRKARLFPFPESILKSLGRLPGLGALRKLTSSLYVDSEPLREDLGWSSRFTMEEGLVNTLQKY